MVSFTITEKGYGAVTSAPDGNYRGDVAGGFRGRPGEGRTATSARWRRSATTSYAGRQAAGGAW